MFDDGYDPEPGAAGPLVGRIYPLVIWVSAPSDPWPATLKHEVRSAIHEAKAWLHDQAHQHGIDLEFLQGGEFGADRDVSIPEIPLACGSGEELTTWMPDLLSRLGWRSPGQLFEHIQLSTQCDGMHAVVMVHGGGRSYAVSAPGDPDAQSAVPVAACYVDRDGTVLAQTIAHEILHLHGAWDLYEDAPHQGLMHCASQTHFPHDIMFRTDDHLGALEIGPLTRWRIGWETKAASWYEFFRPRSRTTTEPNWHAAEPPPSRRGPASGSDAARSVLPTPRPRPRVAQSRSTAPIEPPPLGAGASPRARAPSNPAPISGGMPHVSADQLRSQKTAYREAWERTKQELKAHGVFARERLLHTRIDPPRSPRSGNSGLSMRVSAPARAAWAAYDETMVDRESLRRSIAAIGGAGVPLELKLQQTFQEWKREIGRVETLLSARIHGRQLDDAIDLAQAYQRRVRDQFETLHRRAANPMDLAIVRAANRFFRSLQRYRQFVV